MRAQHYTILHNIIIIIIYLLNKNPKAQSITKYKHYTYYVQYKFT